MLLPGLILALGCILIGLLGAGVVSAMVPLLAEITGLSPQIVRINLAGATRAISLVAVISAVALFVAAGLAWTRSKLLSKRQIRSGPTWDCGYAASTERMQYTSSSFAQPLTDTFALLLRSHKRLVAPAGFFPHQGSLTTETPDVFERSIYRPAFTELHAGLLSLRPIQYGRVQLYILYIALTLIALLLWQLV